MNLFLLMTKFIKFANLTIRTVQAVIQMLQIGVLIAMAIFHATARKRHG